MRIEVAALVLGATTVLTACSSVSYRSTSPLYTASEAFLIDSDPTFLHPRVWADLWFGGGPYIQGKPAPCIPASVADYRAHPDEWQGPVMQQRCGNTRVTLLPVGTALAVDRAERMWDFENGTTYYIDGHLLDTNLSQHEIILRHAYFVFPSDGLRDAPVQPNPIYFTTEAPNTTQP